MTRTDFRQTTFIKVPEIIAFFWLTKVATTALGETTSDWMNGFLGPAIAIPLMLIALGWTLRRQLRADRYDAWTYWLVVSMVAIFGTSAADALHVGLGIPYFVSTIFYVIVLAVVFIAWHRSEGTLSIHSVRTRRRELFYWATVLATFALGTAAGDMTATTLHLGYFGSILLFAGLIAIPFVGYRRFGMNEVFAFWMAYVLTRPLGASVADWMAVESHRGGLGLGAGGVSLILGAVVLLLIRRLAKTRMDVRVEEVGLDESDVGGLGRGRALGLDLG
ncbi:MAG TPA: hypothetical protein VHZ54_07735 [Solirubrobacterales bacterium]|jgi:uncharacterized membrane-anchored protein|nr:hypothetical protein [Solirubrobacterales bacterium]